MFNCMILPFTHTNGVHHTEKKCRRLQMFENLRLLFGFKVHQNTAQGPGDPG